MELERRAFVECRIAPSEDNSKKMSGYAIVFNAMSQDLGGFREIILPEAVDRTLNEALDVRALVDHDSGKVIGRTRAGTLTLSKRSKGLYAEIEVDPSISYANDILRSVKRGDISGMSFGFRVLTDDWRMDGGTPIREVSDMSISEVSVVSWPAYTQTDVNVAQRSLQEYQRVTNRSSIAWRKKLLRNLAAR